MINIIITVLCCSTAITLMFMWRHSIEKLYAKENIVPVNEPSNIEAMQKILDEEYERNQKMAYDVAANIQSIFLDTDEGVR